jgi:hypothetical protein
MRPAGVLCQCNAAVISDRRSVRLMACDRGRACSNDRTALPVGFTTDVAANYAVPGRARSNSP